MTRKQIESRIRAMKLMINSSTDEMAIKRAYQRIEELKKLLETAPE